MPTPALVTAVGLTTTVGVRLIFGVVLGMFLSLGGFFAAWLIAPQGQTLPLGFLLVGSGVGAGIGGFLGWLKPEVSKPVLAIHIVLVLAGGVAGSWCGWVLSQMLFPEGMYNPGASFRTPPFIGAIVIAALGTNLFAGIFYIFRAWRFREY